MIDLDQFIAKVRTGVRPNKCFYHFTDRSNLDSIKKHGLLAMAELKRRGIEIIRPGGNGWSFDADRRSGMDRYVHLCFWPQHPMEYEARQDGRITSSIFLKIALEIIKVPGVLVTDAVSNKSGVTAAPVVEKLTSLDLNVIYNRTDWRNDDVKLRLLASRKFELLIPGHVPLSFISGW